MKCDFRKFYSQVSLEIPNYAWARDWEEPVKRCWASLFDRYLFLRSRVLDQDSVDELHQGVFTFNEMEHILLLILYELGGAGYQDLAQRLRGFYRAILRSDEIKKGLERCTGFPVGSRKALNLIQIQLGKLLSFDSRRSGALVENKKAFCGRLKKRVVRIREILRGRGFYRITVNMQDFSIRLHPENDFQQVAAAGKPASGKFFQNSYFEIALDADLAREHKKIVRVPLRGKPMSSKVDGDWRFHGSKVIFPAHRPAFS